MAIVIVGAISIPPMRIETTRVTGRLSDAVGFPLHVREARWQSLMWPEIRLADVEGISDTLAWLPIEVHAERVVMTGHELLEPPRRGTPGADAAVVEGLSVRSTLLSLRRGTLQLEAVDGAGMLVRGRADGAHGGWVEVVGTVAGPPAGDPLRVYLSNLVVPLGAPALRPGARDEPALRLEGSIETRPHGSEGERADLDLRVIGVRAERVGHWLEGRVQGEWSRRAGLAEPGTALRGRFELREMGGARQVHAVHGPVDARLALTGERLTAEVDLDQLRVVLWDWFAKQPGERARLSLRARLRDGALSRARVELHSDWGTLHAVRGADSGGEWRLESSWVELASLRRAVPALAALELAEPSAGSMRLRGHWSPERGLRAHAELRGVRLTGLRASIPHATVELTPDRLGVDIPAATIAGQTLELRGSLHGAGGGATSQLRILLEARASRIDLEPLSAALAPLWMRPGQRVAASEGSWQDAVIPLLQALRARPKLLERLQVQNARVDVGHVIGLGLDTRDVALRLRLADRMMRVEQLDIGPQQGVRALDIDLDGWIPKVAESSS